jgi:hypothetical protein
MAGVNAGPVSVGNFFEKWQDVNRYGWDDSIIFQAILSRPRVCMFEHQIVPEIQKLQLSLRRSRDTFVQQSQTLSFAQ